MDTTLGDLPVLKTTKAAIGVLVAIFVLFSSWTIVGAGERGVVLTFGAFNGTVLDPGFHFVVPIAQHVVKMNVQTNKIDIAKSESYSHDLQVVDIHSAINYNLDPASAGTIYQKYGLDFEANILIPNAEAAVKQTIAKYTAEQLLSERSEVQSQIQEAIKQAIPSSFIVTKYALVNEAFSAAYEQAIEAKQVAQQEAEKAQNELKKAQIDAESRIAQAKGEAEAIKIQAQAIQQQGGANYVELKRVEKWDGHYPTTYFAGTGGTPLINIGQ